MPKIMPQNANDRANISTLVQVEAMYQGMDTVYEQSIQAGLAFFLGDYQRRNYPKTTLTNGTFEECGFLGRENFS